MCEKLSLAERRCFLEVIITLSWLQLFVCHVVFAGNVFQGDVQYNVYGPRCTVVVRYDELRGENEWLKNAVYSGIRECAQDFANGAVQGARFDPYSLGETRFDATIYNLEKYVSVIMDGYPPNRKYYRTFYKATGETVSLTDFLPRDVLTKECFKYAISQGWIEKFNFDPSCPYDILGLDTDDFCIGYYNNMNIVFIDRSKPNHHVLGSLIFHINTSDYIYWVREWLRIKKYKENSPQNAVGQKVYMGTNRMPFVDIPAIDVLTMYQGKWKSPDNRIAFEVLGDTIKDKDSEQFVEVCLEGEGTIYCGKGILRLANPHNRGHLSNLFRLYWNNGVLEAEYYDGRGPHTITKCQLVKVE